MSQTIIKIFANKIITKTRFFRVVYNYIRMINYIINDETKHTPKLTKIILYIVFLFLKYADNLF